ncbi:MAG: methyltransferase domain-containing protein [Chloroflexi bacterium]|nr:methyltransferase domain-containing protein [Chloroflexota bacterium]
MLEPLPGSKSYISFWDDVGERFPSLKGAPSTRYYLECERLLLQTYFPPLAGRTLFKTDLWDEAKNTEILRWSADQGAVPFGIDLAPDVVREARRVLCAHRARLAIADVRAIPFADASFDLVYSMGTIEHFPDYSVAVREIFRVLKPGGTAIVGVPNKYDPFLRPLMVHLLNAAHSYGYGMEKSFTPTELRRLLESAGFRVRAMSGVLFMPGWLRMADLLFHTRVPPLARLTSILIQPFAWLYQHAPVVRRHGYLLACVATRPVSDSDLHGQT